MNMTERTRTILAFAGWFMFVFLVTFSILYAAGAVPDELLATSDAPSVSVVKDVIGDTLPQATGEEPVRVRIPTIGIDVPVSNPSTTDDGQLDEYLAHGAVRYPGSGLAGQGNMLIFGHSTGFRVVNNPAYKTFNGIKTLNVGDLIYVTSRDRQYTYAVDSETEAKAQDILVEFGKEKKLTLSTCNTFKAKEDRSVVVAHYVSDTPISGSSN